MVSIVIQRESEPCEEGKARVMQNVAYDYEILALYVEEWGHSSVVEHSTADREVTGSIPVAPFTSCKEIFL